MIWEREDGLRYEGGRSLVGLCEEKISKGGVLLVPG